MNKQLCVVSFGIALFSTSICLAQITTDGSVGPRQMLTGSNMQIGAELGSTRGSNLFHSFQQFDIPTGHSATFTGPDKIQNVISRVTGGKTSNIDGQLRSKVGKADVYLINPSGVVMGANASVDVPAALHLSTADEVRFSDGSRYNARDPASSSLTVAAPESFGFLSPQPATLTVNGSQLSVKAGKHMTLNGGDVTITGSVDKPAKMTAPGGTIRIESVGKTGKAVAVNQPSATPGSGKVTVKNARIETSGDGGGAVVVRAGTADLIESTLAADNQGAANPIGGIDLSIANALTLSATRVQSNSFADGSSGGVRVHAGDLTIRQDGAETLTGIMSEVEPEATGAAGGVALTVDGMLEMDGAVGIESTTFGAGNAAAVIVNADKLVMDGKGVSVTYHGADFIAGISSEVAPNASGSAGDVKLNITNMLSIVNMGMLSSSTVGSGNAGTVTVHAGNLLLDGMMVWIASEAGIGSTGQAGNITLTVDNQLEVTNGAVISSSTGSTGNAGSISLTVNGLLELSSSAKISTNTYASGDAGIITISARKMKLDGAGTPDQFTGISNNIILGASGNAGSINLVVTGLLEILNGAQILSSTFTTSNAGNLNIKAEDMRIDKNDVNRFTGIESSAYSGASISSSYSELSGDAGSINLNINNLLELLNGAIVTSSTFATGNAGTVTVQANTLRLDNSDIYSKAMKDSSGQAGSIKLTVNGLMEILDNAQINSSTAAIGNAGSISVYAKDLKIDGKGKNTGIMNQALMGSTGNSGSISVDVSNALTLLNGARITSDTYADGAAGNILVQSGELTIDGKGTSDFHTGILANAHFAAQGQTGKITLNVSGLARLTDDALISVTDYGNSADEIGGSISVNAGTLELFSGAGIVSDSYFKSQTGTITISTDNMCLNEGQITSDVGPDATGNSGMISVDVAHSLELLNASQIAANTYGTGNAGQLNIQAEKLWLSNGSGITTYTAGGGHAGNILVQAVDLQADGQGQITRISSDAGPNIVNDLGVNSLSQGGNITVEITNILSLLNGARISSKTYTAGAAGDLLITADQLQVDGGNLATLYTGIFTDASRDSSGQAGNIHLQIAGLLQLVNDADISSDTRGTGTAGYIDIASRRLYISAASEVSSSTFMTGDAGTVTVQTGELRLDAGGLTNQFTGIATNSFLSIGHAGNVNLKVENMLEVLNGADIGSNTFATGDAGNVTVLAKNLYVIGNSTIASGSSDESTGDSGSVTIQVEQLLMDGVGLPTPIGSNIVAGIASSAGSGGGKAGTVSIDATHSLEMRDSAGISTASNGGDAGSVTIHTGDLLINGEGRRTAISSRAMENAFGQVGDVEITANQMTIRDGGVITIAANQTLDADHLAKNTQHLLKLTTDQLMLDSGLITAQSTGNVPAAAIQINANDLRLNSASRITTESLAANAGAITIDGDILWLRNSQITTSAEGQNGDGGDIVLTPRNLILQTGFIQANTAASGARGGDIRVNSDTLIASQRLLAVGGNERQTFIAGGRNIIQAAAPGGEQGNINILALNLDISASVVPPSAPFGDPNDLLADICRTVNGPLASSLIDRGNGGVPADPSAPVAVSLGGARLDRILNHAPE
ncbi:filamentous hemagglutinin N-terminal domain-containing protein [Chromatium okenii]|uniref:two-partner secretion domain-containing protein n=1 Tax=Chromatium okenii TaxID=61644 RepID=UPI0026F03175|nr:filamentous hemagglutinin N-terminal domain-containing protein [Chromatium okenii]MBV5309480.1 filamentous hemagglutinin N-terminal domain-containing protein [Chromatium okenii]